MTIILGGNEKRNFVQATVLPAPLSVIYFRARYTATQVFADFL